MSKHFSFLGRTILPLAVMGLIFLTAGSAFAGSDFTLTVEKGGGEALTGKNVYLFSDAGSYLGQSGQTDANGQVLFDLDDGPYKFRVDTLGYQYFTPVYVVPDILAATFEIVHVDVTVTVTKSYQSSSEAVTGINTYLFTAGGAYQGVSQQTNGFGEAVFSVPPGSYRVRADWLNKQVFSDPFDQANASINFDQGMAQVTFIQGGNGVESVPTYVFSGSGTYLGISGTTGTGGLVEFTLPTGEYKFRCDFQGDQDWSDVTVLTADTATPVTVDADGGVFTLTVTKGSGIPLTGKNVYVFTEGGSYLGMSDQTDGSGQVQFNLSDGAYKFRVDTLGYQYFTQVYTVPTTLSATHEILHVDVTVTVLKTFQTASDPVTCVNAYLFTEGGAYQGVSAQTDGSGQAVFNVPPGNYKIRADWLGKQVFSAPFDQADTEVVFEQGKAEVTFIQGGNGIPSVNVYVFSATGSYLGVNGQTGPSGVVDFYLPTGDYKFRGDYQGGQDWSDVATLSADVVTAVTIDADGGTFTLTVTKGGTTPLTGANIYVFAAGAGYLGMTDQTDASGQVLFDLAGGDYEFRVDTLGYQYFSPVFNLPATYSGEFEILHTDVTITVNKAFQGIVEPLSGVNTHLFTEAGAYQGMSEQTDTLGQVVFNVPPGNYRVRADWLSKQVFSAPFDQTDAMITFEQGHAEITVLDGVNAVHGVNVYLFSETGSYLGIVDQTAAGEPASFTVPANTYKFRADYGGSQEWSDPVAIVVDEMTSVLIQFNGNGGTASITWAWTEDAPNPVNGVTTALNVNPATGELFTSMPLINLPVASFNLQLSLHHRSKRPLDGPLGNNWTMECFARIFGTPGGNVTVLDGKGHVGEFTSTGGGTYDSPAGWYCTLYWTGSAYEMTWPHKEVWTFLSDGRLESVVNRNGQGYACTYSVGGDLLSLTDTLGRKVTLDYYATGRVFSMSDWYFEEGKYRRWFFGYTDGGDLASVALPGTAQHDFQSPTYEFEYQDSRIIKHTAPDGLDICQNTYAGSGECITRTLGDSLSSVFTFAYSTNTTTLTSPVGNVTDYLYSAPNPRIDIRRQFTRGLRPDDPPHFDTQFSYNTQGEFFQVIWPRGNTERFTYDEFNSQPENRGNRLSHTRSPVSGDPSAPLVETWTYEPNFQFVKTYVSERGNAPGSTASQYTTTWYFDYEEAWLGDLNGDGIVEQNEGNVVKRDLPTVTQPVVQSVSDTFTWYPTTGLIMDSKDSVGMITHFDYDFFWNLMTKTADVAGLALVTTYSHNSVGLKLTETDPNGNLFSWDWNKRDQCVQETNPAPFLYRTRNWYDLEGKLERIDRENKDGNNIQDPLNPWFTTGYQYNNFGQVTHISEEVDAATVASTQLVYDLEGLVVQEVDPEGNISVIVRDERGLVLDRTEGFGTPEAATSHFDYDLNGAIILVTNPRGFTTAFQQDGYGRRIRVTDALTHYTLFTYDEENHITVAERFDGITAQLKKRTTISFDELGRPWEDRRLFQTSTGSINPDSVTTIWHNARGQVTKIQDPNGNISTRTYDMAGRLISTSDSLGNQKTYTLDSNGNSISVTTVEFNQVTMSAETYVRNAQYDQLNRMTQLDEVDRLNPLNVLSSKFKYDSKTCMVHRTDALGDTVTYEYDAMGRNIRTIYDLRNNGVLSGAITVKTGYDLNGNVIWREDDNNNRTSFSFNARDEMTSITYANSTSKMIQRDPCGNISVVTDPNGNIVTTTYNAVDLPISRDIVCGAGVGGVTFENFKWDACRRCIHADNDDSSIEHGYDSLDNNDFEAQVLAAWPQSHTISNTLDASSNITKVDHEGWVTDFVVDANNRRTSVATGGIQQANYLFVGAGLRSVRVTMANSAQMNAVFDGFMREVNRDWSSAPQPNIASFTNMYNNRHERIRETWNHYGELFTNIVVDSIGRMIASGYKTDPDTLLPDQNCTYDIDGVDNRITVITNGVSTSYISNSVNSYTAVGSIPRTHDANGNLANDGTHYYIYNYRNELIEIRRVNDGFRLGTYTYDPFGRRISREYWDTQASEYKSLKYVYNGWQVKAEYEPGSPETLFCRYAYGNGTDEPLMVEVRDINDIDGDSNTDELLIYYYHRDSLGSITHLTNHVGDIVERYECTPFGQTYIYTDPGPDAAWNTPDDVQSPCSQVYNTYIFQSRRIDSESGLYYFRSRHYDSNNGRFIQRDQLGDWFDPSNFGNGYNFVSCKPMSRIDPMGYDFWDTVRSAWDAVADTRDTIHCMGIYIGAQAGIAAARQIGWNFAADMFSYFLSGLGGTYNLSGSQLTTIRSDQGVQNAINNLYSNVMFRIQQSQQFKNFKCGTTIALKGQSSTQAIPSTNDVYNALGTFTITAKWSARISCPCVTCGCLRGQKPVKCDCERSILIILMCSINELYDFARGKFIVDDWADDLQQFGVAANFVISGKWTEYRCYKQKCHGKADIEEYEPEVPEGKSD